MTVVNIKTDFGAKGDGQLTSAQFNITAGQPFLQCNTAIFVPANDVGRFFALTGAGAAAGTLAGVFVVDGSNDSQHMKLSVNAGTGLTNSTQTLEWGTNDAPSFKNFNTTYNGQSNIELDIPSGRYIFAARSGTVPGGLGVGFTFGITPLIVQGAGTPVLSDLSSMGCGYFLGSCAGGQFGDTSHLALTQSATSGSTTIVLLDNTLAALFNTNTWALMTGLDTFGPGNYPTDQYFYEYVYIVGIVNNVPSAGLATITIQAPLQFAYSASWPAYGGFAGGPATLYALENASNTTFIEPGSWDADHTYNDLGLEQFLQTASTGRSITFNNGHSTGFGILASRNLNWTANNFTQTSTLSEFDKLNVNVTLNGGTWRQLKFQSSSAAQVLTLNAVTTTVGVSGTPKKVIASNCTLTGGLLIGPVVAGNTIEIVADNCSIDSISLTQPSGFDNIIASMSGGVAVMLQSVTVMTNAPTASGNVLHFPPSALPSDVVVGLNLADLTTPGAFSSSPYPQVQSFDNSAGTVTMTSNVIGTVGSADNIQFTVDGPADNLNGIIPGSYILWNGHYARDGGANKVNDITANGRTISINTDASNGFPSLPAGPSGLISCRAHPCQKLTLTNCNGCDAALAFSNVPAGLPAFSRWKLTYSGNIGTGQSIIPVFGKFVSIVFDVTTPYIGSFGSLTLDIDNPFVVVGTNPFVTWSPSVNLAVVGKRVITALGTSGAQSGDSLVSPGNCWIIDNQIIPRVTTDISSGTTQFPVITIELIADHGIVDSALIPSPAPPQRRHHAWYYRQ